VHTDAIIVTIDFFQFEANIKKNCI